MNKKVQKIVFKKAGLLALIIVVFGNYLQAQTAMSNVESRHLSNLNGEWQVILDPTQDRRVETGMAGKKTEKQDRLYRILL